MRIDLAIMVWDPHNRRPYRDLLSEAAEAAQLAEQAGFGGIWVSEHHFQSSGFDISPNPLLLAAHLANATSTIRVGVGAVSLPLWNPIRAAEDAAIVDHMSNGRLDMGFSRGISPLDIVNLNPNANRADPARSLEVFEECVDVFTGAWREEAFRYEGKHYRYPQPNLKVRRSPWYEDDPRHVAPNGDLLSLEVLPKPLQKPEPPLYNVSETVEGFEFAAERDFNAITWFPNGSKLRRLLEAYQAKQAAHGRRLSLGERCGLLRPGIVAKTAEAAREILTPSAVNMAGTMGSSRGLAAFCDEGEDGIVPEGQSTHDFFRERDQFFSGTAEQVTEQLTRYRDTYGIQHYLCWLNPYGVPHRDMLNAISLYGEAVIPALKAREPA